MGFFKKMRILFIFLFISVFITACTELGDRFNIDLDNKEIYNIYPDKWYSENIDRPTYEGLVYRIIFESLPSLTKRCENLLSGKENNINTYECLYTHALLTSNAELCIDFPESGITQDCNKYGCSAVTHFYQEACIEHVTIFKNYVEAENKVAFCKNLPNKDYEIEACIRYEAIRQNKDELCSEIADKYGCLIEVNCLELPYGSLEDYQCRLDACKRINGIGCRLALHDTYSQYIDKKYLTETPLSTEEWMQGKRYP